MRIRRFDRPVDTLVLGGGMIGQYATHKLKATLVTLKPEKSTPYIFLHDAPENRAMLEDLKVEYSKGVWRIGFMWRGEIFKEATEQMVNEYHTKCYGHPPSVPQFKKPLYNTLTPNYYNVRNSLEQLNSDSTIYGKVIGIDLLRKTVGYEDSSGVFQTIRYKHMINTLPLPDVLLMTGTSPALSYRPICYYKQTKRFSEFDTVQVMDLNDPRTRYVEGTADPDTHFLETLGTEDTNYGELATIIRYGKISNNDWQLELRDNTLKRLESHGVYSLGRFARWAQHYDTQHALSDLDKLVITLDV